jgi:putative ABC transport system permease protein
VIGTARAVLGGALARNRGRLALSVAAIALGVALGFAVALVNASAVAEFSGAMKTLAGQADLEVRGPRGGFDERVFAVLARDPTSSWRAPWSRSMRGSKGATRRCASTVSMRSGPRR